MKTVWIEMKSEVMQVKDKKSDSMNLNILEKADLYTKSFPKYCPLQYDGFYGLWMMGFN